jgi:hypothetical protein
MTFQTDHTKRRIFKYELEVKPRQPVWMPKGAIILSFGRQGPLPYLWVSVDEKQPLEMRWFRMVTTGEVFNGEYLEFVGHLALGGGIEPWYQAFLYEIEIGAETLNPDPISDRFLDDMAEAQREIVDAVATDRKLVAA